MDTVKMDAVKMTFSAVVTAINSKSVVINRLKRGLGSESMLTLTEKIIRAVFDQYGGVPSIILFARRSNRGGGIEVGCVPFSLWMEDPDVRNKGVEIAKMIVADQRATQLCTVTKVSYPDQAELDVYMKEVLAGNNPEEKPKLRVAALITEERPGYSSAHRISIDTIDSKEVLGELAPFESAKDMQFGFVSLLEKPS